MIKSVNETTAFLGAFADPPNQPVDFHVYGKSNPVKQLEDVLKRKRVVVASSPTLQYVGELASNHAKYAVGVVSNGEIILVDTPALKMTTRVRDSLPGPSKTMGQKNLEARNSLGQTFGTKKRRQAIAAKERNTIDTEGLSSVAHMIKDTIAENAASMPSKEQVNQGMMDAKVTPPCNLDAASPDQVYALEDIAPARLIALVEVKPFWNARVLADLRAEMEPLKIVDWVWDRIELVLKEKKDKDALKKLLFLAYMFRYLKLTMHELNRDKMGETCFMGVSPAILEYLSSQFTERQIDNGKSKVKMTNKHKDKLMAYIIAFMLTLSHFKIELALLSACFSLAGKKVNALAKELGCRIEGAGQSKRAVLSLPLSFPTRTR